MLLGFKRQFAPFVENGSKTHTIRARGKRRRFRVGDVCDCYVDSRQSTMRLLGRFPCVRVQDVRIEQLRVKAPGANFTIMLRVFVDGAELSPDEANEFFRRDGFRRPGIYPPMAQARDFWSEPLAKGAFEGDLIHWEFKQ